MGADATGDLSEYEITYLFVDGIAERLRPGGKREPVMAAWGFTDRGPSRAAAHDDRLERRCRDGDGFLRGYEAAWANRSAACDLGWGAGHHQGDGDFAFRALSANAAWRIACATWQPRWPEYTRQAAYQAPSRAIARELAAGIVADHSREQERGVACFMDDFESSIVHLRFPVKR
jgi:hypothetical protein